MSEEATAVAARQASWAGLTAPKAGQWAGALLVPGVTQLLPLLLDNPSRLAHPAPWVCFLGALVIYVTQPPLRLSEARASDADGKSVLGIALAGLLLSIAPVWDFGFRTELRPPAFSWWVVAGTLLVAAGTGLRVWAIAVLGQYFTAVVAVQDAQPVVDYGPYRYIRHPSYSGALVAGLGASVLCESWLAAALTLGVMLPIYLYRVAREEAHLGAQLGEAYARYRARTTRLVPYLF